MNKKQELLGRISSANIKYAIPRFEVLGTFNIPDDPQPTVEMTIAVKGEGMSGSLSFSGFMENIDELDLEKRLKITIEQE
jgi:hypothetical protein